jgi:hypothetical protein
MMQGDPWDFFFNTIRQSRRKGVFLNIVDEVLNGIPVILQAMYVELSAFSYELPSVSITPCLH